MTSWFESVRRQFGSMTEAKCRRHGSGGTRRQTPAFVESLEDRCLLAAGELDPSFGTGGKVTTGFPADAQATSIALQSDGKIVVFGGTDVLGSNASFALIRYNADGSLDTSFDQDGKLSIDFAATSIALQVDGKIVVAGSSSTVESNDFALARYNSDGTLDTSFGDGGKLATDFSTSGFGTNDYGSRVALQADGKIVVAGRSAGSFALARYNSDGSLDSSFDDDGMLVADIGVDTNSSVPPSMVLQEDGKIVVAGGTQDSVGPPVFGVARINSDGSPDTSFDGDGKLTTKLGMQASQATSLALQSDGKIVVAGSTNLQSGALFALARYNSDGSLDSSFDGNGKVTTQFGNVDEFAPYTGAAYSTATGIALQSDGAIVVAGYTLKNSGSDFAIARYNSDGSLDTSFNDDGKLTTGFRETGDDQANAIAIQTDGRIVVAGFTDNEGSFEFALARYNSDTVVATLPTSGGNVTALIVDGALHIRRSLTSPDLIAPVALAAVSTIQFEGSNRTDRLTLDGSLNGFAGTITFNGNAGNDTLVASTIVRSVTFSGGVGNDTFLGGNGNDFADGGSGNDSLSGGNGDDSLGGGDGNDKLSGDMGADSITGGAGADSVSGGAGDDLLLGNAGNDTINGGDDDDSLSGGDANDRLTGDAGNDTVTGDAGADIINGGDDDDLLFGNAGKDTIDGGRGDDVIDGGDDNDNLKGSDGDDAIRGGIGNDTLSGGKGDDLLTGSAGNDSLNGDDGIDTLLGDDGNDKLNGGTGIDRINGVLTGPSKDTISDSTKVIDTSFAFDFDALLAGLL